MRLVSGQLLLESLPLHLATDPLLLDAQIMRLAGLQVLLVLKRTHLAPQPLLLVTVRALAALERP